MPTRFCARAVRALRLPGLWTVALAFLFATAVPAQAQTGKGAACKSVPVNATFHALDTTNGGLFGHTNTADTTYVNGVSGTVVLLVCNGTGDFWLNLSSTEFFTYDFSKGLVRGDVPLLPAGTRLTGWVINVNKVGNLARYTNESGVLGGSSSGELDTQMQSTLYANNYLADYVLYCDNTTLDCSGKRQALADKYSDTSLIRVTVDPSCSSWTIEPVPVPTGVPMVGGYSVAGLIDQTSARGNATLISGGQYSMPFSITLTRSDGVTGCAGLLQ